MYVVALDLSTAGPITLLEALTTKHKSSRGKEQQMELLPFTALGHVIREESWGAEWMQSRQDSDVSTWDHFLQSWSESTHDWVNSRMSTAEATGWLRELLEPSVGSGRASKLTIHGLKATLLSWAAKSTLFTADEQLALGHHVSAQYRSAMIYSRDNQISLCKKVHDMFSKIREGSFDPDGTRVSRLFNWPSTQPWKWRVTVLRVPVTQRMFLQWPLQEVSIAVWIKRALTDDWRLMTWKLIFV